MILKYLMRHTPFCVAPELFVKVFLHPLPLPEGHRVDGMTLPALEAVLDHFQRHFAALHQPGEASELPAHPDDRRPVQSADGLSVL